MNRKKSKEFKKYEKDYLERLVKQGKITSKKIVEEKNNVKKNVGKKKTINANEKRDWMDSLFFDDQKSCPKCNGTNIGYYVIGLPSPKSLEKKNPYVRFLGCIAGDDPDHFCLDCGYSWKDDPWNNERKGCC